MSELNPCPFCGFKQDEGEVAFDTTHEGKGSHSVYCENCHTTGPMRVTMDMAIFAWNERVRVESEGVNEGEYQ